MISSKKQVSLYTLAASLILATALLVNGLFAPPPALAQDTTPAAGTVTVVGEGMVSIEPDMATATVGVDVVAPGVREAVNEARDVMQTVLDALSEAGIAEEDIQTSGYNIWADRNFGGMDMMGEGSREQVRYHVNNMVTVTIRDLDNVSTILDVAIEAGANNIYGVNFSLEDPTVVESEAREKAVANALAKAQELATLTGAEVGRVISISEVIGQGGGYFGGNFAQAARDGLGGGGAGPIAPGQLNMTMQLQITYELR
jgi:uncharacterized protein YggE